MVNFCLGKQEDLLVEVEGLATRVGHIEQLVVDGGGDGAMPTAVIDEQAPLEIMA